jgi:tetratricopeptide (TPR) repeat protein
MIQSTGARPSFWQRRYLLRRYEDFSNASLAQATGLSEARVAEFLASEAATRSRADERRIARGTEPAPVMFTPQRGYARLTRVQTRPLRMFDVLLLLTTFAGSALLYLATAARTVTGEDAGEFLAAAHTFGVPHPPGYPLWLVLAWAADHLLPFGTVALRVTLVSLIPSAIANTVVLALLLKTMRSRLGACAGAGLFAVSLTHWTQAVIPEVYGLNTLFIALQVLLLVLLAEAPSTGRLLLLALVTGLSATNHTSAAPVGLLVLVASVIIAPALFRRPAVVMGCLVVGLAPLLLYAVLPLASARNPYVDWGHPKTLSALVDHVTRAQYTSLESERQVDDPLAHRARRLLILSEWGAKQFGSGLTWILAGLGFVALLRRQTGLTLLLFLLAWLSTIVVIRYATFSFDREHIYANQIFWIPAWMACAVFVAGGVDAVLAGLRRRWATTPESAHWLPITITSAAGIVVVALTGAAHFPLADRSGTKLIETYGRALLDVMEPGALYFPSSDHSTFSVLYQQGVLGHRPDVTVADKYGQIERDVLDGVLDDEDRAALSQASGKAQRTLEEAILIRKWPGPVYFANKRDMTDVPDRQLEPVGPLFRVMTKDEAEAWWQPAAEGEPSPGMAVWDQLTDLVQLPSEELVDFTVQMVHGEVLYLLGFAQLRAGRIDEASATWDSLVADLAPLKQLFNNIGSALAEADRTDEALSFYERALAEDSEYVLALRNVALVHKTRHDTKAAIAALQRLLDVDPKHREARFELAQFLDQQERPLEALAQYEELARRDRSDPRPWKDAGELLARRGDRAKAQQCYAEALRLDPNDQAVAQSLDRLRQGIDLLASEEAAAPSELGFDEDALFGMTAQATAPIPGLPPDPAAALRIDPMRGRSPPEPSHRP